MVKDRGHRENRDDASHPRTEGGDLSQRARSFFDRATERAREAARDIGRRVRGDDRERGRGYGMRDEYEARMNEMYGGRESGRDWMRDERNRDYVRDEDRGFRASLGGDYRMSSANDRAGRDRDDNRSEQDDRSRGRRW